MLRIQTYNKYKDVINKHGLKQQLFLENYVINENDIDRLLLFHGIGSGKTRSSILIAESIMTNHPEYKVNVILPARLKTNYIDEFMTYIDTIPKYKKLSLQAKIKLFEDKYKLLSYESIINLFKKSTDINKTLYEFTKNRILIVDEFHNLISNNVENSLVEQIYNKNKFPKEGIKVIRAVLMRYISKYAHNSCKMFFLTATPIFDNYKQFIELVKLLNKNKTIDDKKINDLNELIPFLKGKISYYSSDDRSDFPNVKYKQELIPLSQEQFKKTLSVLKYTKNDDDDNDDESFMMKQRQIAISLYGEDKITTVINNLKKYAPKIKVLFDLIINNPGKHLVYSNFVSHCLKIIQAYLNKERWVEYKDDKYKPYKTYILWDGSLNDDDKIKIKKILNSSKNIDGKIIRVILGSPSIKEGVSFKHIQHLHQIDPVWNISAKNQIEGRCIRYKSHEDIKYNSSLKREVVVHNYISVAPIENDNKDDNSKSISKNLLSLINKSKERVLIYSDKLKIYNKLVKKLLSDNNWIDYSKRDKNPDNKKIYTFLTKRELLNNNKIKVVFSITKKRNFDGKQYNFDDMIGSDKSSSNKSILKIPENFKTCDEKIYYDIIPKKTKLIKKIEEVLKKAAVDFYIYKSLSKTPTKSNTIRLSSDDNLLISTIKKRTNKDINKCPKNRRPINNMCAPGRTLKKNKYGNDCCYVSKK